MSQPQESTITAPIDGMSAGQIVGRLAEIREEKAHFNDQIKELNGEQRDLEFALLRLMEEQGGATRVAFGNLTASRTEQVVPIIRDWDAFEEYVRSEGALHMLQRRVATTSFKEMIESGQEVPGLEPYVKVGISLRKTK